MESDMALRDKIRVKKTIELSLTAEDWDLYSTKENVEGVANVLNQNLQHVVNSGVGCTDAIRHMCKVMDQYAKYGAADTEPMRVLDDLINLIYGDSDV
jgi:hypothetical protein